MNQVKLSISLSPHDIETIDRYVEATGLSSRSAAIQRAVGFLREPELENQYEQAWVEWQESADADVWAATVADGLS